MSEKRDAWRTVQDELRGLMRGEYAHLHLTFNDDCSANYMTVKQYVEDGHDDHTDWVSDEEKQRAMEQNSMWTLHWYPDTPIGFYSLSASSLTAIAEALRAPPAE